MKTLVTLRIETDLVTLDRMEAYGENNSEITLEETFTTMEEAQKVWAEFVAQSKDEPEFAMIYDELFDYLGMTGEYRVACLAEFEEREDDGSYWLDV